MIHETQNPKLKPAAQKLRKDMTREERHLWYDFLKTLPVNVNRQKVIGPYIVDFYVARAKIVIELDGSQHYEPEHRRMDLARDEYLAALGLQVLRYSNADVRERFSAVCTDIWKHVFSDEGPHPSFGSQMPPSPKGPHPSFGSQMPPSPKGPHPSFGSQMPPSPKGPHPSFGSQMPPSPKGPHPSFASQMPPSPKGEG